MTSYYVDPAASGSNTGADWTNAWTSLQSAADTAVAGDIVYCRGTQTLTAAIDFDTNAGTSASIIEFIGVNSSGVQDGTKFTLDGNSVSTYCILGNATPNYVNFHNFECENATSHGVYWSADGGIWFDSSCHNNGGRGMSAYGSNDTFVRCAFNNNSGGLYAYYIQKYFFCSFIGNTGDGIMGYPGQSVYGCIFADNGSDGLDVSGGTQIVFNSVFDGNTRYGIDGVSNTIIGNRFTNHSEVGGAGFDANASLNTIGYNYFENNTTNILNDTISKILLDKAGVDTNKYDQSNTNQGYTSLASGSEDYNLNSTATLRRIPIQMDID